MTAAILYLLLGGLLARAGVFRRWKPRDGLQSLLFGGGLAAGLFLSGLIRAEDSPIGLLAVSGVVGAILSGAAWGLLFRLLPGRRAYRFLYHGAVLLLVLGAAFLFPFRGFWPGRPPPATGRTMAENHEGLAAKFGLKRLEVSVGPGDFPSAVVTSFTGEQAGIIVSRGLMDLFDRAEMDFAVAHELSHHRRRHFPLRMAVRGAALAIFFLIVRIVLGRADAGVTTEAVPENELAVFLRRTPALLGLLLLAALGPLAVCRDQETSADREAVRITGNRPAALSALEKLARRVPAHRRPLLEFLETHPGLDSRMEKLNEQP